MNHVNNKIKINIYIYIFTDFIRTNETFGMTSKLPRTQPSEWYICWINKNKTQTQRIYFF